MSDFETSTIDFVRELRLRQWARKHFVSQDARGAFWHPVVLDEMRRRDQEMAKLIEGAESSHLPAFT